MRPQQREAEPFGECAESIGSRVEPRGARAVQKRAPRAAKAVPGGEALSTKMGDARAEHAPEELVDPAVAWGTLGAHVVTAKGARGE